jgi:hypothetical protein
MSGSSLSRARFVMLFGSVTGRRLRIHKRIVLDFVTTYKSRKAGSESFYQKEKPGT